MRAMTMNRNAKSAGKWGLLALYLAVLHVLVFAALFRPQWIDNQRWRSGLLQLEPSRVAVKKHQDFLVLERDTTAADYILIGDSHFEQFDTNLLPDRSLNFSIGGDTIRNMTNRVQDYQALGNANAIFIWGGYNDLLKRDVETVAADTGLLLQALAEKGPVIMIGTVPVGRHNPHKIVNRDIVSLNDYMSETCIAPCHFLNILPALSDAAGNLRKEYARGDAIHLNRGGYAVVARMMIEKLRGLGV